MNILIDCKEQKPFTFVHPCKRVNLDAGDYSIDGMIDVLRWERKRPDELWGCLGAKQEFFRNQLSKLSRYPYRLLIVEGSVADMAVKPKFSRMVWQNVAPRLMKWTVEFGVPVWFLGPRSPETTRLVEDLMVSVHDLYRRDRKLPERWKGLWVNG